MQLFSQWRGVSKYLLSDPATFYDHYDEDHEVGYPMAFLGLSAVVVVLPLVLVSAASNYSEPRTVAVAVLLTAVFALVLWLWTLIEAAIAHAVLSLFGASGYATSLEAYAFPTVIRYALWWVPVVGVVFAFVGLYLQARGMGRFHDVSETAAAFAVIVAALVPFVLLALLAAVATLVMGVEAPGGTQPPMALLPF